MVARTIPINSDAGEGWKERALTFRAQRQQLLASNIANADTPGFKARDASFSEALEAARASAATLAMTTTSSMHASSNSELAPTSTLDFAGYRAPLQNSLDGNTVDMDIERAAFVKNSILYQFAVDMLKDEVSEFKQAANVVPQR